MSELKHKREDVVNVLMFEIRKNRLDVSSSTHHVHTILLLLANALLLSNVLYLVVHHFQCGKRLKQSLIEQCNSAKRQ